ncbi:hypothetical protein HHK36_023652 [Tetracentron sinense]|uniref:Protein kinase domain-containing protein n=1 Tax=Tetracentron sinense TaxID=13715 RepID=A0A835D5K6_TETSI|nr:hypothetical protein HHK36_023652 [Tetracentron sinense]
MHLVSGNPNVVQIFNIYEDDSYLQVVIELCDSAINEGIVGTSYYVAPEVISGTDYNEKVYVWSARVILYIMLVGFLSFYGEFVAEIFEAVLHENLWFPTRIFHFVSPTTKDLLRRMLCKDVSRRFSVEQVLRHLWTTSGGEAKSMTNLT